MTNDDESIARFYDLDPCDLPLVTPLFPPEAQETFLADVHGAVDVLRGMGLPDDAVSIAARSMFRDELRRRPHLTDYDLETYTATFDRLLGHVLTEQPA